MKRLGTGIALVVGTLMTTPAFAGRDLTELSLEELMNIPVVSASKTLKPLLDHSVTAFVVTHDQIEERGYRDLLDVLRDLPGIYIVDLSVTEHAASEIFVRGIDANTKMLFLMDGEEIAPPTGEPFTFLRNVSLVDVAQVEVSYGTASSLYGADAIAGIVNVVTFTGDEGNPASAAWLAAGSHDTYDAQLRHYRDLGGRATISVSGGFHTSSQEDLPRAYPDIWEGFAVDASLESYDVHAKLDVGGLSLSYLRMYGDRNNSLEFLPTLYDYSGASTWNTTNQFGRALYEKRWTDSWSSKTAVVYSSTFLDSNSSYSTDFTGNMDYVPHYFYWNGKSTRIAQEAHMQRGPISWLGGAEAEWFESTPKTDIDNPLGSYEVNYRNLGAFTQVEIDPCEWFEVTAGVRYDRDSRFEGEWNPRVGFLGRPWRSLRLHGNWGTAYLAPSPHKVYERWGQIAEGEFVHLPNPDLKPEQTSTFDAGIDWFPTRRSHLLLSGFYTRAHDLWRIAFKGPIVIDGYNLTYQTNDNVAESMIRGFDFEGDYELPRGFQLGGQYTYTDGNQDAVDLGGKVDLNHVPRHQAQLSTTWRGEGGSARLVGRWFDRITSNEQNLELAGGRIGGAWTFDFYGEKRLSAMPNLRFGIEARNLFDEPYEKVSQFDPFFFALTKTPQPRRFVALTARVEF